MSSVTPGWPGAGSFASRRCRPTCAEDLLPVDEAFVLTRQARRRERVEFTWRVAEGYYLYRHRIGVQPVDSAFKVDPLQLPKGKAHIDEFFGDGRNLSRSVTAVLTGAAATRRRVGQLQGEVPGLRRRRRLLSAADAHADGGPAAAVGRGRPATAAGADPLRGAGRQVGAMHAAPWTPAVAAGTGLRLRSDRRRRRPAAAALHAGAGLLPLSRPHSLRWSSARAWRWARRAGPAAKPHRDEHFGDVASTSTRSRSRCRCGAATGEAATPRSRRRFQGCQTDGICYPPMTRTVVRQACRAADAGGERGGRSPPGAAATPRDPPSRGGERRAAPLVGTPPARRARSPRAGALARRTDPQPDAVRAAGAVAEGARRWPTAGAAVAPRPRAVRSGTPPACWSSFVADRRASRWPCARPGRRWAGASSCSSRW